MSIKYFNPDRLKLHISELAKYHKGGNIFFDQRRGRPRWFDGRFLTADDLNRESEYFLARQADLAMATGAGVVEGLKVNPSGNTSIEISQGHGMTFDGMRVAIPQDETIALYDIPLSSKINAHLGLSRKPSPPDRFRTGTYIIALRPLEFTANPVASYPVDVDGKREMQDGDIVEAVAVVLVPFKPLSKIEGDYAKRRARIAHDMFTDQVDLSLPTSTLPLAMVEMRRGVIQWLDNNMVRRDMGSVYSDVLGFGFVPRPLRRSHFLQYDEMIDDVVDERLRAGANLQFSASEYFTSLPSAGRLPTASVDLDTLTQYYFPDAMDVEMSIIPDDELAALVEESLLLPPLKLNEEEQNLASNSVMIFLPVPRTTFYSYTRELKRTPLPIRFPTRTIRSRFQPQDYIKSIRAKLPDFKVETPDNTDSLKEVAWKNLVKKEAYLWYVRRRNVSYKDKVTGSVVHVMTNEHQDETVMRRYQRNLNLYDDFTHLKVRGSAAADLEMVRLLTIPKFTKSEVLMRSALKEFNSAKKLDEKHAAGVSTRFASRSIGSGIEKIEARLFSGNAEAQVKQQEKLALSLHVPELDLVARSLHESELEKVADDLKNILADENKDHKDVKNFIKVQKKALES